MQFQKVTFTNRNGQQLAARLELPANQRAHTYALFAHCFTCNKNLTAVRNISRALNLDGIAVLRFDFTGLGESEGDFADTNFTSNIEDLIDAAHFLAEEYQAPKLLIGHSLGGAAVLCATGMLPDVKAVATIGAPSDPAHVAHLIDDHIDEIEAKGTADVTIGGRTFQVKKQFLEDIKEQEVKTKLQKLNKALLIMHSPQDRTVAVENAAWLYEAARHPKSFITLDGADHLMSNKADSQYAGSMIASWAQRYLDIAENEMLKAERQVAVRLGAEGYTTEVMVRHHGLTADEPTDVGGNDYGPNPYELVTSGLGACTAMTMHMYARRKNWDLREVVVHLDHAKDYPSDMQDTDNPKNKIDIFKREIELEGNLNEDQIERLMDIADRCPVHRTLHSPIIIETTRRND